MIYNQILSQGLNSNIAGIRQKAENGIGNYSFKGASPVTYQYAINNMSKYSMKSVTRGENTIIDGVDSSGKHIYFAGKTESPQIQALLKKKKTTMDTKSNLPDNITTTTTYDRWLRNTHRKFDDYYNGQKGV